MRARRPHPGHVPRRRRDQTPLARLRGGAERSADGGVAVLAGGLSDVRRGPAAATDAVDADTSRHGRDGGRDTADARERVDAVVRVGGYAGDGRVGARGNGRGRRVARVPARDVGGAVRDAQPAKDGAGVFRAGHRRHASAPLGRRRRRREGWGRGGRGREGAAGVVVRGQPRRRRVRPSRTDPLARDRDAARARAPGPEPPSARHRRDRAKRPRQLPNVDGAAPGVSSRHRRVRRRLARRASQPRVARGQVVSVHAIRVSRRGLVASAG
mmetsp:Transcript_5905/g.26135  ORF Transcript_5905/g.26135 Transcript_5905/m.26135 type:complete len:270 (-) Transcript_5905:673-1482(-)